MHSSGQESGRWGEVLRSSRRESGRWRGFFVLRRKTSQPPLLPSDLRPNLRGRRSKPLTDGYSSKGGAVGGGCAVDWGSVIQ